MPGYGGGGGASMFHDGAYPIVGEAGASGTLGSGGGGGSYRVGQRRPGGHGGNGVIIIYY